MENKKGITLIAVIITVIVMLILAGVSINLAIGDKGVIEKSHEAAQNTELSESKEHILETWAYVLAKCEDITTIANSINDNKGFSLDEIQSFNKASNIFSKYISDYGEGTLENEIIGIKNSSGKITSVAFKITFLLKEAEKSKIFYIVDDTKVYEESEFFEYFQRTETKELKNN